MKDITRYFRLFLVFFALTFNANCIAEETQGQDKIAAENIEQICLAQGGEYKIFNNGCAGYCDAREAIGAIFCTQALKKSCECGEGKCFERETNTCRYIQK